jgi:hypothetical protein
VENNRMQTLPERSQRDHWKFLYQNQNQKDFSTGYSNRLLWRELREKSSKV